MDRFRFDLFEFRRLVPIGVNHDNLVSKPSLFQKNRSECDSNTDYFVRRVTVLVGQGQYFFS